MTEPDVTENPAPTIEATQKLRRPLTYWFGVTTFTCEGLLVAWGTWDMMQGSCSAALMTIWFGLPLVALTIIAFVIGSIRGRHEGPSRKRGRSLGLALALTALPVWITVAQMMAMMFG